MRGSQISHSRIRGSPDWVPRIRAFGSRLSPADVPRPVLAHADIRRPTGLAVVVGDRRAGLDTDSAHASVVPPVFPSTTFRFAHFGDPPEFDYGRNANPTRATLSHALARLEHGVDAVITSSGMAAIMLTLDALVPPGGRVVAAHDCYGGTWRLLTRLAERGRFSLDLVDLTRPDA